MLIVLTPRPKIAKILNLETQSFCQKIQDINYFQPNEVLIVSERVPLSQMYFLEAGIEQILAELFRARSTSSSWVVKCG